MNNGDGITGLGSVARVVQGFFTWARLIQWSENEIGLEAICPRTIDLSCAMVIKSGDRNLSRNVTASNFKQFMEARRALFDGDIFQHANLLGLLMAGAPGYSVIEV